MPCIALLVGVALGAWTPPGDVGDAARLGRGVERTMALLAQSTPEAPNTVRILFYGQSITEQDWWREVVRDLEARYPSARLETANLALGGFSSQRLVRTAETDVLPFDPDLMIFHVYGAHDDYARLIRLVRSHTASEVLLQTDHVTRDEDLGEETDPARLWPDGAIWNSFMNYLWLPQVARECGCGLVEQRDLWKTYLRQTGLPARELLRDDVHLNENGCRLMAEFVKAYLVPRVNGPADPWNCDTVRTRAVGGEINWRGGRLTVPFTGSRVDLVLDAGLACQLDVSLDKRRPSDCGASRHFTRALAEPGGKWPVILRVGSATSPDPQHWSLEAARDGDAWSFRVHGSVAGDDGAGRTSERFVSDSGQVVIEPADWDLEYALALAGVHPVPEQFSVSWDSVAMGRDRVISAGGGVGEVTETIVQGWSPDRRVLEITGEGREAVRAVRIYTPPLRDD